MKNRVGIILTIFIGIVISVQLACKKKTGEEVPSLVTINVSDITSTSISSGGLVFSAGGDSVISRGLCLSTETEPEVTDIKTINGSGTGSFTSTVSGLMPGTNYYVRAYAANSIGTGYGNQFAVTTKGSFISLTTAAISSITATSAIAGGTISGDESTVITSRGVCWSTTTAPTISDNKTTDGSGIGTFTSELTGLTVGITYFIRAYAISSTGIIYGNELTFKAACDIPSSPLSIAGNTIIDPNSTGVVYSIAAVSGATEYNWKVPPGAAIVSGQGTTTITVNFGTTGGNISVSAGNTCGSSAFTNLAVSTCPVPSATGAITGAINVAPNASGIVYSVAPVNGATKYNWKVPSGAVIVLGQGTTAITVDFGASGGNVSVQAESNCGTSTYTDLLITLCSIPSAPGAITGTIIINQFAAGVSYSISGVPGATNYTWTVPTGATIVSGQGSAGILVNFGSNGGTVSVRSENSCGKSQFTSIEIAMCYLPQAPETVNGPSEVIPGATGIVFSTPAVQWATDYTWMVPPGATIVSNQGTTTIIVNFGSTGGNVSVRAENNCGISPYTSILVTVKAGRPTILTADVTILTTTTASGGGNITSDGGAVITARGVCWSTLPGPTTADSKTSDGTGTGVYPSIITGLSAGTIYYVRAYAVNSAGTSYGNEVTFTTPCILPETPGAITGRSIVSINESGVEYSILAVAEATYYNWTVPLGSTIVSGQGTATIKVNFGNVEGDVTVTAENNCGKSSVAILKICVLASFTDSRDGKTYRIVQIGTQTWMAENMAYLPSVNQIADISYSDPRYYVYNYNGSDVTAAKSSGSFSTYGVLYNWPASVNACPSGWHLPSDDEWKKLEVTLGMPQALADATGDRGTGQGAYLKTTSGWVNNGNGDNSSCFSALPSGYYDVTNVGFLCEGSNVYWWGSEYGSLDAWSRTISFVDTRIGRFTGAKTIGYSVRCVQGEPPASVPVLATVDIPCDAVTSTTAAGGGNITSDGGSAITERGVCWSTASGPTIANDKTTDGPGSGIFASVITGLNEGLTYYLRAYATNSAGTAYGNEVVIKTVQTTFPNCGNITDIDGNIYKTVTIGTQCWMAENLKTTKYQNGDPIPNVTDNAAWWTLTTGAYCWYNNDEATFKPDYGALYNWYTVSDSRNACPSGWHVPNEADWETLTTFLGGLSIAAGPLKETCFFHWGNPNTGATNSTGFTALPGGYRDITWLFSSIGDGGHYWSSTGINSNMAWDRYFRSSTADVDINPSGFNKMLGFSVRCVKGEPPSSLPSLATIDIPCDVVTSTTATGGGNITSDGGSAITERGVCWSTSSVPTTADSKTSDGFGTGSFTSSITGLNEGVTYYVRAYATNSAGTAYGNEVITATVQTTFPNCGNITDIDGNIYKTVTIGTQCWMEENLKTTKYRNGDPIPNVTDNTAWTALTTGAYSWYNNDEASYKNAYGALYNCYTVSDSRNLCPVGWHVPTDSEWSALSTYLGGEIVAAGLLKETCFAHWDSPNGGASNSSGFTALPGGYRGNTDGIFYYIRSDGHWWTSTEYEPTLFRSWEMHNGGTFLLRSGTNANTGFSVRCVQGESIIQPTAPVLTTELASGITGISALSGGNIVTDGGAPVSARGVCWTTSPGPTILDNKTTDGFGTGSFSSVITGLTSGTIYYLRAYATNNAGTSYGDEVPFTTSAITDCGTVIDIDGNIYNTATIGTQCWMADNLKTTRYQNGDQIPNVTDNTAWSVLTSGAYCWFNNDATTYQTVYGALYNWYAVADNRNICPSGWHVPTDDEWTILTNYLGGENISGGLLKETGTSHWFSPNLDATNASGFSALPGGYKGEGAPFDFVGKNGYWWSVTDGINLGPAGAEGAMYRRMDFDANSVLRSGTNKGDGFSVRCVQGN